MTSEAKTDNAHLRHKLELRRYFLNKYHTEKPPRVFDCCQGDQVIWTQLKDEFKVHSYWGVDLKPKKGRIKIDSKRILNQPGWKFDLIDVDTYGSPFGHLEAIREHMNGPLTVFLTIGKGMSNFAMLSLAEMQAVFGDSITRRGSDWVTKGGNVIGPKFMSSVLPIATQALLCGGSSPRCHITEAVEAMVSGNPTARYIGIRLELTKPASR